MPTRILLTLPADDKQLREEIIQQLAPHADVYVEPSQKTGESSRAIGLDEVKLVIEIASGAASFVASATEIYESLKRLRDQQKERTKDVRVGKRDEYDTYLEDADDGELRRLTGLNA
jgi:hypothetical protein